MKVTMRTTVFILLAALALSPAHGQVTTATFYGTVTDSSQAVLPGVSVTMSRD